jgi:hypothetical protein
MAASVAWAQGEPAPPAATGDQPLSLIRNGDFRQDLAGNWGADGGQPQVAVFDTQIGGYTRAVRLECAPVAGGQPWDVGFGQRITATVRKGEAVYFRAWMRSPDRVRVSFILESVPGFIKVIGQQVRLTPEWREYRFMGRAFQDFPPGGAQAKWWLGYDQGVVEISGVRVEDYGMAPNHDFDQTIDYWGGREHSDAWRAAALERIEKLRKGDLTIRVLDAAGRPVPQAQVKVEQQRHYFRFGTAVPAGALVDTQNPDHVRMQAVIARLFNTVTFENDLKWAAIDWGQGEEGQLTTVNRAVDWCRSHEIDVRGHCLLWGSYEHLPAAVRSLRGEALREA